MKLTNEAVAKALGWKRVKPDPAYPKHCWIGPKGISGTMKPFTTSLDAITAEIEAQGLRWTIDASLGEPRSVQAYVKWMSAASLIHEQAGADEPTAPLALCAALLAYLKDRP